MAEHSPDDKRGYSTSWIQTTATLGFFLSLAVILASRMAVGEADFKVWGWRIPFLVSVILLGVSVYIRLMLKESPVFAELKAQGKTSKSPLKESFGKAENLKVVLLALFGATAGQGVVWYTGQFYALFFLQNALKVEYQQAYILIAVSLLIGTPLFIFFGSLSDKIGRKKIMMTGLLLSVLTTIPLFKGLTHYANPALEEAVARAPIVLLGGDCGKSCHDAREFLTKRGAPYSNAAGNLADASLKVGETSVTGFNAEAYSAALNEAGYPEKADPARVNEPMVVLILAVLVSYVAMVYGPIAAFLVELFPARIRYTSMSLPYHLGNGWFGGFLPLIAASVVVTTGDMYAGLWYPIGVAIMSLVVGGLLIKESKDRKIMD